jgi:hypothetical protein
MARDFEPVIREVVSWGAAPGVIVEVELK